MEENQCFQLFDLSPQIEHSSQSFFTQRQYGFCSMQDFDKINIFFKEDEGCQSTQKQSQVGCQKNETLSTSQTTIFEIFLEKRSRKIADRPLIDYSNLSGRKKMIKNKQQSSIFHNYQKHLIVGLKNMLKPELYCFPNHLQHVVNDLWSIFLNNFRQNKKIARFIFCVEKTTALNDEKLKDSGFQQVYQRYTRQEILQAKIQLSKLASRQLTKERVDSYLSTRRIKDSSKFKQYLGMFLINLEKSLPQNEEIKSNTSQQFFNL